MPRTLVLTNDFPPRIGGIESFVADACELLDRDVVVYASGPAGDRRGDTGRGDVGRGYPVVRGGPVLTAGPATIRAAVRVLQEHGADRVLLGAAAPLGLVAPALRRAGATRVVGLTHGHEVWWARVPAARRLLRRIGDSCDHLTSISDFTTAQIAPALSVEARARMLRLAPPVDGTLFRPEPGARDPRPRCVAVGRFVVQKGLDALVTAWRSVQDGWPTGAVRPLLVLVGDGPQRTALLRQVAHLDLTSAVRFTGPLPRTAVVAELQAAQVFALPVRTRWAGLNAEGLGLAAIEAAACGLPVVVGDSGGAPETLVEGRSGHVVVASNPGRLAAVLTGLLLEPERAAAMGAAGRRYVLSRYSPERARSTLRRALGLD
ncbi:glycosyltransferase family 4 protein [uncultured Friedmanniella sp.]|uniref:glycosyltransferase family 4 protein n=1 Tax=uncultured Friedmanniella sp. TaxID=335381 RepID=UPI0035CB807F